MDEPRTPLPPPPPRGPLDSAVGALRASMTMMVVRGVPVRVHLSTLVALPFFAWLADARMRAPVTLAMLTGGGGALVPTWAWALLLTLGLVGAVLIHEGAHALAARLLGGRVGEIDVLLLGGCCRHAGIDLPAADAVIAAAGPFASLVTGVAINVAAQRLPFAHLDTRYALTFLAQVQVAFGAINLIPAPPLDGGRVLIAVLEGRLGRARATWHVARFGQVVAAVLAAAGALLPNLLLIALAGVVWAGADEIAREARGEGALRGVRVRSLLSPASSAPERAPLSAVVERMRLERAPHVVLTDEDGAPSGVVLAADVGRVPPAERAATPARAVARPAPSVGLDTAVVRAATMMRAAGLRLLPVVDADRRGALVGVVTAVGLAAAEELRALDDDRAPASEPARDRGAAPGLLRPVEE